MTWIHFFFVCLLLAYSITASPFFFVGEEPGELKKKINNCGNFDKKKGFQFKEKHFELQEFDRVNEEMSGSAKQSGKDILEQIKCIQRLKISETEKEELKKSLEAYKEIMLSFLEYYNRWLYSFEKSNLMTPMDKKFTSELILLKFDLYSLLHTKTAEVLARKELPDEEELEAYEMQIRSIYLSILKGNFEYYNAITPALRKEILKRIADPKEFKE